MTCVNVLGKSFGIFYNFQILPFKLRKYDYDNISTVFIFKGKRKMVVKLVTSLS